MEKPHRHSESAAESDAGGLVRGPAGQQPTGSETAPPVGLAEIDSELLLGGRSEVRIRHRGDIYRLTLTRAGKLILHK